MCPALSRLLATILKSLDCPDVHLVPSATGIAADHIPLAQRWKDDSSMQFHSPSVEQAPLRLPSVGIVDVALGLVVGTTATGSVDASSAFGGEYVDDCTGDGASPAAVVVVEEEPPPEESPDEPPEESTAVPVRVGVAAGTVPVAVIPAPPVQAGEFVG